MLDLLEDLCPLRACSPPPITTPQHASMPGQQDTAYVVPVSLYHTTQHTSMPDQQGTACLVQASLCHTTQHTSMPGQQGTACLVQVSLCHVLQLSELSNDLQYSVIQ